MLDSIFVLRVPLLFALLICMLLYYLGRWFTLITNTSFAFCPNRKKCFDLSVAIILCNRAATSIVYDNKAFRDDLSRMHLSILVASHGKLLSSHNRYFRLTKDDLG